MKVCVIDCSKPLEEQVTYRDMTRAELAQHKKDKTAGETEAQGRAWIALRVTRDQLLAASDHQGDHLPWAKWRDKLRDLPATTKDPDKAKWPNPPKAVSTLYEFRTLWPELDWSHLKQGA